jgi:amino acid adenylation domain-containing protein
MTDLSKRIASLSPAQRQALMARLKAQSAPAPAAAPAIARIAAAAYPASIAQERMWFLHRLDEGGRWYSGSTGLRLSGPLDRRALGRAVAALGDRHEVLRSTFEERAGTLMQIPHPGSVSLRLVDLTGQPAAERLSRAQARIEAQRDAPFDPARGPLFLATLFALDGDDHILLLSAHHIVADGVSIELLSKELSALYAAFAAGRPPALDEPAIQFGDFARWEREAAQSAARDEGLAYWTRTLAGLEPLALAPDHPGAPAGRSAAAERAVLAPAVTGAVRALAKESRTTLFMTLLAAFDVLLHRVTGQRDIAVGTPVANRAQSDVESLVGLFVNLLVLRARVSGDMRFRDVLEHVSRACVGAFEHQNVPFGTVVEALSPERGSGENPLVQVTFAVQTASFHRLELPGVEVTPYDVEEVKTRFGIEVHAWDRGRDVELVALYDAGLYDRATVAALLTAFVRVVEAVVATPDVRVSSVPLIDTREQAALLAGGTGAPGADAGAATLAAQFAAVVAAHGDAVAIEDGSARWTYAALGADAARLAGVLRAHGAGPNRVVGVWQERNAELLATLAGITVAGAAYLPLDPSQPVARAAAVLTSAGVSVVVTTEALRSSVPPGPWAVITREEAAAAPRVPLASLPPLGSAADLAYVLFTSGSTGTPKGVAVPQRAVTRLVVETDYVKLDATSVIGQAATAAFDAATFELWGAWLHGARLVVIPTPVAIAPAALGAYLQRTGVTTLFLTTALLHQIGREAPGALRGLDTLLFGGEAVEPRWVAAMQAAGRPRRILHVYGPTENTTFSTWYPLGAVDAEATTLPIGGPIAQSTCYVVDAGGALAPTALPGELLVGGEGLATGYLGGARLTAERFVPDPFSGVPGARLYRTGDIVRWTAPGVLTFIGRRDGQVKLRGNRIELGEVEAALRAVPGVGAAVAVVQGVGAARQLVGYVEPLAGAVMTSAGVRGALQASLPAYMVPAAIGVLPQLPLNANGKVDRRALPAVTAGGVTTAAAAPRSVLEGQIAAVWCSVLGLEAVGVEESFFDVGGHSLLLVRVQAGLESALGRAIPLVTLFQYPTVAALAAHLADAAGGKRQAPAAAVAIATASVVPAAANAAPIAIIGLAGRFPGADDVDALWAHVREGRELLHRFTWEELAGMALPAVKGDGRFVPVHGLLGDADRFDADLFGVTPREATLLDPQQRVLLECAWSALEAAGYGRKETRPRVGIYAGTSHNSYFDAASGAVRRLDPLERVIAGDKDFLATRVGYKLDLGGPAVSVQTACSTSLVAVHLACQALRAGECEVALAGGVSITVPAAGYVYQPDGIASPDGHCRPFDARAQGTVAGNGVAVVVLKPLEAAVRDGDRIHAVIRGSAINNDGADKVGFTAPSVSGQAAAIATALAAAGVAPETIGYVEAHGTGTTLGDPIEVAALREVFGDGAGPATCGLGSAKGSIGHLDAAAGVTGLIVAVKALQAGEVPATAHFDTPNPQLSLGPFTLSGAPRPWPQRGIRRAGVSSFGMGGTNAHVVLEQAPAADTLAAATPGHELAARWQVVPVSAQTAAAVAAAADRLAAHLETPQAHHDASSAGVWLRDVAYTQQVGRAALPVRRVAVGTDAATIAAALRSAPDVTASGTPPIIWMCPGQGTQVLRMGEALYARPGAFRDELDACAGILATQLGADLRAILYPAADREAWAADQLRSTTWTQAALVAVGLALAAQWRAWGVTPSAVLGHSVGEITAAAVAGVLSREAALTVAAVRGRAMASTPAGGMLAIAAGEDVVTPLLGDDLWLAAINRATQCVVSGPEAALVRAEAACAAQQLRAQRLPAVGAFHSGLMTAAAPPLDEAARALPHVPPQLPWISSVTGTLLADADAADPGYWARQVTAPVLWAAAVDAAAAHVGAPAVWLELGPGHTLTQLLRGAVPVAAAIAGLDSPDADEAMAQALASLWAAGATPDWSAVHAPGRPRRIPLPTYPFQRQRYWLEPDAGDDRSRASGAKRADVGRWFYTPQWTRLPLDVGPAAEPAHSIVFTGGPIGEAAWAALERSGHVPVRVERGAAFRAVGPRHFEVDPRRAADMQALVSAAGAGDRPWRVLHGWSATSGDRVALGHEDDHLASVWLLVRALAAAGLAARAHVVVATCGASDVVGNEPLHPSAATVIGLSRVAAQEHAGLRITTVDVPGDAASAMDAGAALAAELLGAAPEAAVAYRAGLRWVERFAPRVLAAAPAHSRLLRDEGVYVITGGLGRIGLAIARYLAGAVRARLVLVGRSAADPDTIAGLERAGAQVLTITADASDAAQMTGVFARADARFGAVHGVFHAAGVTAGGSFAPLTALAWNDFEAQLGPKRDGARALSAAVGVRTLDFCMLLSSLSTVLGGLGFAAYASANAFMDAFAAERTRATGVPWMAVDWDGWQFAAADAPGGAATRLAMTPDQGIEALARLLHAAPVPRIVVSTADLEARLAQWLHPAADAAPDVPASAPLAAPSSRRQFVEPSSEIERTLAAIWTEFFGTARVGLHDDFFELGGHSLLGMQVMSRVREAFGVDLALSALFAAPTVAALAQRVEARSRERAARHDDQAALLQRVRSMPAEERRRLLDEARRAKEGVG